VKKKKGKDEERRRNCRGRNCRGLNKHANAIRTTDYSDKKERKKKRKKDQPSNLMIYIVFRKEVVPALYSNLFIVEADARIRVFVTGTIPTTPISGLSTNECADGA